MFSFGFIKSVLTALVVSLIVFLVLVIFVWPPRTQYMTLVTPDEVKDISREEANRILGPYLAVNSGNGDKVGSGGEVIVQDVVSGFVAGPTSATDNAIARFDGTTGRVIQNSLATIADNGVITAPGISVSGYALSNLHVAGDLFVNGRDFNIGNGKVSTSTVSAAYGKLGFGTSTPYGQVSVEFVQGVVGSTTPAFIVSDQGTGTPALYVGYDNQIQIGEDSGTKPALSFWLDRNTGFGRNADDQISIWAGGAGRFLVSNTQAQVNIAGTVSSPSFSINDSNTGLFNPLGDADILAITNNAIETIRFTASNQVGIGTTTPRARLAVEGASTTPALLIRAGNTTGNGAIAISVDSAVAGENCDDDNGAVGACALNDIAELFPTDEKLEPATLVAFSREKPTYLEKAREGDVLAGIISTAPAISIEGSRTLLMSGVVEGKALLAKLGRVPVKVNNEGGEIFTGDMIGASSVSGEGKSVKSGWVVGQALEPLLGRKRGTILVDVVKFYIPEIGGRNQSGNYCQINK